MKIEINNSGDNSPILFDKRALNKLMKEELKKFSSRPDYFKSQPELLEELRVTRVIIGSYEKEQKTQKKTLRKRKLVHAVYLSIILFTGISVYTIHDMNTVSEKETFEKYYNNYSSGKSLDIGLKAYTNEDFRFAADNLSDSIYLDGRWLKALSLIEEKEYKKACLILTKVNTEDADWLIALCLLRMEEHYKAVKRLEEIYTLNGSFSTDAKNILEEHYYNYNSKKSID